MALVPIRKSNIQNVQGRYEHRVFARAEQTDSQTERQEPKQMGEEKDNGVQKSESTTLNKVKHSPTNCIRIAHNPYSSCSKITTTTTAATIKNGIRRKNETN